MHQDANILLERDGGIILKRLLLQRGQSALESPGGERIGMVRYTHSVRVFFPKQLVTHPHLLTHHIIACIGNLRIGELTKVEPTLLVESPLEDFFDITFHTTVPGDFSTEETITLPRAHINMSTPTEVKTEQLLSNVKFVSPVHTHVTEGKLRIVTPVVHSRTEGGKKTYEEGFSARDWKRLLYASLGEITEEGRIISEVFKLKGIPIPGYIGTLQLKYPIALLDPYYFAYNAVGAKKSYGMGCCVLEEK